jgi:hypothetical protein
METQTALVGTDSVIELDTVAGINLNVALIIYPSYLEGELTIGFNDTLCDTVSLEFGVLVIYLLNGHQYLTYCLKILFLTRMTELEIRHKFVYIHS